MGTLRVRENGRPAPGSGFASRAMEGLEPGATIRASCAAITQDLLAALTRAGASVGRLHHLPSRMP